MYLFLRPGEIINKKDRGKKFNVLLGYGPREQGVQKFLKLSLGTQ